MDIGAIIVCCADLVFAKLGPGHSESVYHRAMEVELRARVIRFESKAILPITYRGLNVGYGEADLIVYGKTNDDIVVELKATTYAPRAQERAQLLSYLRSRGSSRGLLINFRQPTATIPCPEQVDWEEVWLEDQVLVVKDEGVAATTHTEKEAKTNDCEEHKTKGESG